MNYRFFLLLIILFSCRQIAKEQPDQEAIAGIFEPVANARLSSPSIDVLLKLHDLPDEQSAYLAVKKTFPPSDTLYWPKIKIEARDNKFEGKTRIFEFGRDSSFDLLLISVGREGNNVIEKWFDKGEQTGDYPALEYIPGMHVIDQVANLSIQN